MGTTFRAVNLSGPDDGIPPPNGIGLPIGARYLVSDALPGDILVWELMEVSGVSTPTLVWRSCGCSDDYYYYTSDDEVLPV